MLWGDDEDMIKGEDIITKYGNAKLNEDGYYIITSRKKGYSHKFLHRLIWEDWYGKSVPDGYVIHHLNGDKTDNRIQNLQCVERSKHIAFHNKSRCGENSSMFGKHHSEETKRKISKSKKGKSLSKEGRLNMSKSRNTTGYYHVYKENNNQYAQGFLWRYKYHDKNNRLKSICATDLEKLEKKVKEKGFDWIEIDRQSHL